MPRINTPGLVYRYQGEAVSGGLMYYFESGTTTPKTTYKDANESIANTHPVVLNADGTQPNVFFSGSAKQRLTTSVDEGEELVFESDPIGGQSQLGNFSDFSLQIIYNESDIVRYNNKFYVSLVDNNQGNDPETDAGVNWEEVDFVRSVLNKDSAATLDALKVNILTDATTFKLPEASTVKDKQAIFCWKPDRYKANIPSVQVENTGTDTVTYSGGTDTIVEVDTTQTFAFVKNGANNWDLVI